MLDLTLAQQAALANRHAVVRTFIWAVARNLETGDPEEGGFWNDVGNVTVDGRTYAGSGSVVEVSTLNATSGLEIPGLEITLNGINEDGVAYVRGTALSQAPITVSIGIFDLQTRQIIGDLIQRFIGFIDDCEISDPAVGGAATIKLSCESTSRALTIQRPDTRSSASQAARDPNDRFFEYTSVQRDKPLYFGQATPVAQQAASRKTDNQSYGGLV